MYNIPIKIDGVSTLPAAEFNSLATEVEGCVTGAGYILSGIDNFQLSRSMTWGAQSGNFYADSGTANAVILNNSQTAVLIYSDGMEVRFRKPVANTGAVTITVQGLGVVPLLHTNLSALTAGQIPGGQGVIAYYSGALSAFVIDASLHFALPPIQEPIYVMTFTRSIPLSELNSTADVRVTAAAIVLTLPALSGVTEGQYMTFIRDSNALYPLTIAAAGAELVGTIATQVMYGDKATLTVRKINGKWQVSRISDPSISVIMNKTTNTTITNNVDTLMIMPRISSTGGLDSSWAIDATGRVTVQIAGDYQVFGTVIYEPAPATGGSHTFSVLKNGAKQHYTYGDLISATVGPVNHTILNMSYLMVGLIPGDYIQLTTDQITGASLITHYFRLEVALTRRTI